jgi:hypothetical protein
MAFGVLGLMILFNATTNQKQAAVMEGTMQGICNKREVWGSAIPLK